MTQNEAYNILKLGHNSYITGAAGSGKTYLLNKYINYLKDNNVAIGVTASTGIAATHIGGVTIHSWSGLGIRDTISKPDLKKILKHGYLKKRYENTKVLVIDEISMIGASQFDLIDYLCRAFKQNNNPFGGMQVICSGDLFQLSPIQKNGEVKFAVDSRAWAAADFKTCYLDEQHRQGDGSLLELLSYIRSGKISEAKKILNEKTFDEKKFPAVFAKLYTHNADVDFINNSELEKIQDVPQNYFMNFKGSRNIAQTLKKGCLAPENLELKKGAKVMFVKNNFEGGYINGTLGEVIDFSPDQLPIVRTVSGKEIEAEPATWMVEEDGHIKGQIRQIPLRLAWAITVHKSQGMNLDAAEIDLSKSFTAGMGYVALSRLKTFDGLKLVGINEMALKVNDYVLDMDEELKSQSQSAADDLKKIDEKELVKRQNEYLAKVSDGKYKKKKASIESKQPTIEITKACIIQKMPIYEIAKTRELSVDTIMDHIEKIISKEELDIEYLRPKETRFNQIKSAFSKSNDFKLRPAKEILGDSFSYPEIRLARLFINK